jgi:hypothetical protein
MLKDVPREVPGLTLTGGPAEEAAVKAIVECVQGACASPLSEALELQARHSAEFMTDPACRKGEIGGQYTKTMAV